MWKKHTWAFNKSHKILERVFSEKGTGNELVAESISKIANHTKPSTTSEYENLIDIKCSSSLKQKFESEDLISI